MKFIEVTGRHTKQVYYVNAERINYLQSLDKSTYISFGNEQTDLVVEQTPEQIINRINHE